MAKRLSELLKQDVDAKTASNFLMGEVAAFIKEERISIAESKLTIENFGQIINNLI